MHCCHKSLHGFYNIQGSSDNFTNPERGFSVSRTFSEKWSDPLYRSDLQRIRNTGVTLVRRLYIIEKYRNSELPQSFLNLLKSDFETARQAGVKLVIRFAYNWDSSGTLNASGQDASKDRIFSHLDQMQPILQDNKDALAYMQAGFIGSWGEWHHSSNSLENTQDKTTILNKVLSVLPSDRMVALRYPRDKMAVFNNSNPLTPQEAFNGSYRARTGAHNDCFVSSIEDMGTYHWSDSNMRESEKNFLNLDNRYVVQGGETCYPSQYDDCPNVLKELGRMRWSQMEAEFHETVLQGWRDQGCMEEIRRRLGYRFRLINSTLPDRVKPNGTFTMSFKVTNDGWASPYNPRSLEVILRHRQTGQQYYLPVATSVRKWMPGTSRTVKVVGGIPANMPVGEYQVLLNLPDPTSRLYLRSEYSIRFANQNVWEASTGYNSLLRNIVIDPNTSGDNYSGSQFFKSR
jgi:hypothetical protein